MGDLDRNLEGRGGYFLDKRSADWTAEDLRDYGFAYAKCLNEVRGPGGNQLSEDHLREGGRQARILFERIVKPAILDREARLASEENARLFAEEQDRARVAAAERERRARNAAAAQQARDDETKAARAREQAEIERRSAEDQHRASIAAAERRMRAQEEAAAQQAKDDETKAARAREQAELAEARRKVMIEQAKRHAEADDKLATELARQAEAEEAALAEAKSVAEKAAAARRAAEQRLASVRSEALALKTVKDAPLPSPSVPAAAPPVSEIPERVEANATPSSVGAMNLDDFRLDYEKLRGRTVTLAGTLMMQADTLVLMPSLYKGIINIDFIFLDWDRLPRERRKQLMDRCRELGCSATVRGRATDVMLNKGLLVEAVSLN